MCMLFKKEFEIRFWAHGNSWVHDIDACVVDVAVRPRETVLISALNGRLEQLAVGVF